MSQEKFKVLIADDDFRIGLLIKELINWDEFDLELTANVTNSDDALEAILCETPDIVITDIQMPRISGLDLIERAKEVKRDMKFIVVSGYKDFEYAHRALQYDVTSYLLKPIDEAELNDALKKIMGELALSKEQLTKKEDFQKVVSASERIVKKNIIDDILDFQRSPSLESIKSKYGLELTEGVFRCVVIKLDYTGDGNIDVRQDQMTQDKALQIAEDVFGGVVKEILFSERSGFYIYCLLHYDPQNSRDIKDCLNELLTDLQQYLRGFDQYKATLGISMETDEPGRILTALSEARRAVDNRAGMGAERLIFSDSVPEGPPGFIHDFFRRSGERYLLSVESFSSSLLAGCIDAMFDELSKEECLDYACFYELSKQLIYSFFEKIDPIYDERDNAEKHLMQLYVHCYSASRLKAFLKKELGHCLNECAAQLEQRSLKPIRDAKRYINEHKGEKISLEDIAKVVDLNPVYFSVLFKKETGMNFNSYLINLRIDAAKDLLVKTKLTVLDIADKVGYKDVRYFSKLFSKTVGVNPAIYRKIHS